MVKAPTIQLNNGAHMPVIGLGTLFSQSREIEEAVKNAIDCGYRHIDTAFCYGNEKDVGRAIRAKIEQGVIKREDIFVVTKLWSTDHEPSAVLPALQKSLQNLGLSYVDLYLMHFPVGFAAHGGMNDIDYLDTWKAMEPLVEKGLAKSIGISNFNSEQIERLLNICKIKPVTNQVECNVGFNQKKLRELCRQRDIAITAYCPLGQPEPSRKSPAFLFDDRVKAIGAKYNKTAAQVALRYLIQEGMIVIPKSVTKHRIAENINIFDFELSTDDMNVLETFHTGKRKILFHFADSKHKYYPFNIEF